jgi:hypothetical protein
MEVCVRGLTAGLAILLLMAGCADDNGAGARDLSMPVDAGVTRHDLAGDSGAFNGPKTGVVTATSSTFMVPPMTPFSIAGASASFDQGNAICADEIKAPCTITRCGGANVDYASAGTVSVYAPARAMPLTLTAAADGSYAMFSDDMGKLWDGTGSEMVRFVAAGAEVPMFDDMVVAPGKVTIMTPVPPAVGPPGTPVMGIPRNADLTFTWMGSSPGDLTVVVLPSDTSTVNSISCAFSPAANTGTVPKEVLGRLPAGMATLVVGTTNSKKITAGAWTVSLVAVTGAVLASDGSGYTVPVTMQ